jgi:hypothetical protein
MQQLSVTWLHVCVLAHLANRFASLIGPLALGAASSGALADLDLKGKLSKEQLRALLQDMDSSVRALPATAQVCVQGSCRQGTCRATAAAGRQADHLWDARLSEQH